MKTKIWIKIVIPGRTNRSGSSITRDVQKLFAINFLSFFQGNQLIVLGNFYQSIIAINSINGISHMKHMFKKKIYCSAFWGWFITNFRFFLPYSRLLYYKNNWHSKLADKSQCHSPTERISGLHQAYNTVLMSVINTCYYCYLIACFTIN